MRYAFFPSPLVMRLGIDDCSRNLLLAHRTLALCQPPQLRLLLLSYPPNTKLLYTFQFANLFILHLLLELITQNISILAFVLFAVPQGSVLEPILFVVYAADLL